MSGDTTIANNDWVIPMLSDSVFMERFWNRISIQENGCWEFQTITAKGYGKVTFRSKSIFAHRVAYVLHHGYLPDDLVLDHLCRNRSCVNPNHLEAVTMKENVLRGVGRAAVNYRKTSCNKGHEFTPENTCPISSGGVTVSLASTLRQQIMKKAQKGVPPNNSVRSVKPNARKLNGRP